MHFGNTARKRSPADYLTAAELRRLVVYKIAYSLPVSLDDWPGRKQTAQRVIFQRWRIGPDWPNLRNRIVSPESPLPEAP